MPRLYACPACGARTPNRTCPEHADHARRQRAKHDATPARVAKREADPFTPIRKSAAWRRLRRIVLDRDGCCQHCGHEGSTDNPLTADHIVPRARGGALLPEAHELTTLCRSCNARKGAR